MHSRVLVLLAVLFTVFSLSACQSSTPSSIPSADNDTWQSCYALAADFRQRVAFEEATNAGFPWMVTAPFLHSTRFYDRIAHEVTDDAQARELLSAMASLGDRIRRSENSTLSNYVSDGELDAISSCSHSIVDGKDQETTRRALIEQIKSIPVVRDHYSTVAQWTGLLPLMKPFLNWRINVLHKEERELFAAEENFTASHSYQSQDEAENIDVNALLENAYTNSPLNIPQLSSGELLELFEQFAPRLTVESLGIQDRLGTPTINNGRNTIDTNQVTAYYLPSYTRFLGQNLLQLNYVFWFPSREPRNFIDLYSGEVDSLIWRVTFDTNGEVLLYDSIHSCGCYHKYFLASKKIEKRTPFLSSEPANVFNISDMVHSDGLRIVVTSNEHYIVGVNNAPLKRADSYELASYFSLFELESSNGVRSFFDDVGIITGSERLERLTLWPTGIRNVGAMRQWGTHATGFVERQYFDDATLFDKYFRRSN